MKNRPPHLHRERTRHGKIVWVVRIGHGPRTRIEGEYGSAAFLAAYRAALAGGRPGQPEKPKTNSLAWLVDRYRETLKWTSLSMATRKQRENILKAALKVSGAVPFGDIRAAHIQKGIDRRASSPFSALHFLKTMRGLFQWAVKAGLAETDPTARLTADVPKNDGYQVWSEDEIRSFERRWSVGTRERLAFDVLLYTGLRRGDAARLGHQHIRNGEMTIRTEKTGEVVSLTIKPELLASIKATKTGDMVLIATAAGQPFNKEAFGNWFRDACNAAGLKGSAHGLRKAAATRLAEGGATTDQLNAIFGWRGGRMAFRYTDKASRRILARDGMAKMAPREQTGDDSLPSPNVRIPAPFTKSS